MIRRITGRRSFVWAAAALWLFACGQTGSRAQDAPLPSAKDIIARHVNAIGGAEAWQAIKSMRATGTFSLTAQGMSGALELLTARPSNLRLTITLGGVGKIESGYDGKIGWSIDPMSGPALMTGRELQELSDDASFDSVWYSDSVIKEFTPVGREAFERTPAIKVKVVLRSGTEQFEFFDAATGLLMGFEGTRATPMGTVPTTEVLGDYKTFGAVKVPTTVRQRALGFETLATLTAVEFDKVPAEAFNLPPAIKALIK